MDISISLSIIIFAALIHSSFQLSISVLTILSGHSIGAAHSHKKLIDLSTSFICGVGIITLLLISSLVFFALNFFGHNIPQIIWAGACGLLFGVAVSIWMFYYRREKGTTLWIPRGMAKYLMDRTKSTNIKAEAFSLGVSSILGEILFIIAPLLISALVVAGLSPFWQIISILIYTVISMSSLIVVWILISRGYNLGRIQKWREANKYFMQFIAGAGLIVLSIFVYVNAVVGTAAIGGYL